MLQLMFGAVVGQNAEFNYRCDNNIRREILSNRLLTSGYYVINKPSGKCSHGGCDDDFNCLYMCTCTCTSMYI